MFALYREAFEGRGRIGLLEDDAPDTKGDEEEGGGEQSEPLFFKHFHGAPEQETDAGRNPGAPRAGEEEGGEGESKKNPKEGHRKRPSFFHERRNEKRECGDEEYGKKIRIAKRSIHAIIKKGWMHPQERIFAFERDAIRQKRHHAAQQEGCYEPPKDSFCFFARMAEEKKVSCEEQEKIMNKRKESLESKRRPHKRNAAVGGKNVRKYFSE